MKSKKIMGLLLAGALLVGTTAYGSYAYFTDSATTDANLTIAMGNLDIELVEKDTDEQWAIVGDTESYDKEFSPTDSYANVRPGDLFTRTVTIENGGTLKANIDVAMNDLSNTIVADGVKFSEIFNFSYEIFNVTDSENKVKIDEIIESEKGDVFELVLNLQVNTDLEKLNAKDGSESLYEINIENLLSGAKFITITADQINK